MSIDYLVLWDQTMDPDDGETRSSVLIKRYAKEIERQALERAYAAAYKADTMACNAIRALIEQDASSVASKEGTK